MTEEEFTACAIEFLKSRGVQVAPVPPLHNVRTPDLRGSDGIDIYAIELKQRDSHRHLDLMINDIEQKVVQTLPPMTTLRDQAAQSLIRECVRQLSSEAEKTFRIGWVHCEGFDAETDQTQLQNSFLGNEYLVDCGVGGRAYSCYFFRESDFWRYKAKLDGAIVSRQVAFNQFNFNMLINPHSPRADQLRKSRFVAALSAKSLIDFKISDSGHDFLIADCAIDRKESADVLAYVCGKYGLDLICAPLNRNAVVLKV